MAGAYAELRHRVAEANRGLAAAGLVVHSFGNASEADQAEGVFAIKPSGLPCQSIGPDDVVVLSLDSGETVWGELRPSADTPTHRIIYQEMPSVRGVVHTHSIFATAWAQARRAIPCLGTTHADHFRGEVPVTRPLTPEEIGSDYEANTGRVIAELFARGLDPLDQPGTLVASHGPFVWGPDAAAAVEMAAAVELLAELACHTLAIDEARPSIEEELVERHFRRKHGPLAYYGQP